MGAKKNYKRHGSRYAARSHAVQILYEAEARDTDPVEVMAEHAESSAQPDAPVKPVADYTRSIIEGVAVELNHLDQVLADHLSENWTLDRLPAVDRAVLRVSTWELLCNPEVPTPTAVVEGVELAYQYSGRQSSAYVNGVLDKIAQESWAESPDESEAELRAKAQEEPQSESQDAD